MPIHDPAALEQLRQAAVARRHHPVRASLSVTHDAQLLTPKSPVHPYPHDTRKDSFIGGGGGDQSDLHRPGSRRGSTAVPSSSSRASVSSRWLSVLPPKMYDRLNRDRGGSGSSSDTGNVDLLTLDYYQPETEMTSPNHRSAPSPLPPPPPLLLSNHDTATDYPAPPSAPPTEKKKQKKKKRIRIQEEEEGEVEKRREQQRGLAARSSSMPDIGSQGPSSSSSARPVRSPSWRLASPTVATVPETDELDSLLAQHQEDDDLLGAPSTIELRQKDFGTNASNA